MKNLNKRKLLAAKVFNVGINRVVFDNTRLDEIKEAITKQDIKDLYNAGAISIKQISGRRVNEKRKTKRGPGKIKLKIKPGKQKYVFLVRKLRGYIKELKKQDKLKEEHYTELRKKIKSGQFSDKAHLREHIREEIKWNLYQRKEDLKERQIMQKEWEYLKEWSLE